MLSLLALLVLVGTAMSEGMPPFAVLSPSTLRMGHESRMTVMLFQEIEGNLTLEYYNKTTQYYPIRVYKKDILAINRRIVKKSDRQVDFKFKVPDHFTGYHYIKLSLAIEGFGVNEYPEQRITLSSEGYKTFVQTDKPVYKPGELVRYRAFTVDMNLRPLLEMGGIKMTIKNPNGVALLDDTISSSDNMVHQGQFVLAEEAAIGTYYIAATGKGRASCDFSVEEYVLPKFGVEIQGPGHISADDVAIMGSVSATYTYGKPVSGKLKMTFAVDSRSQPLHSGSYLFHELSMDFVDGKAEWKINIDSLKTKLKYLINPFCDPSSLIITAQVTDDAKGFNVETRDDTTKFVQSSYKLSFSKNTQQNYVAGMPYFVELDVSSLTKTSANGLRVKITMAGNISDTTYVTQIVKVYDGKAKAVFDVPESTCAVKVTAEMSTDTACDAIYACYQPERMVSKHNEFIRFVTEGPVSYKISDRALFKVMTSNVDVDDLHYVVISKGMVIKTKTLNPTLAKERGNTFSFKFEVEITPEINIRSRILIFTASSKTGFIIADATDICIIESMDNSVTMKLSKTTGEPGDNMTLYFDTAPNSFVGITVVDASLNLLKKPCKSLSKSSAMEFSRGLDKGTTKDLSCKRDDPYQCKSSTEVKITDALTVIKNQGVNLQTNMKMFKYEPPKVIVKPGPRYGGRGKSYYQSHAYAATSEPVPANLIMASDAAPRPDNIVSEEEEQVTPRLRNVFPEAWLWTDVRTRNNGKYEITAIIPDTITGWIGTAFGLSKEKGLGFSNEVNFKTFLPFFVSLDLPYSGTVGERIKIKVRVFNYLDTKTTARVIISSLFWDTQEQTVKIDANKATTIEYPISLTEAGKHNIKVEAFSSAGKSDAVERSLLVKPGGERVSVSNNVLIMEKKKTNKKKLIDINLPKSYIAGSHSLKLIAVGDILGEAVTGISNLIQLPSGCGEQNMHKIAINVFASNYVKSMYNELPENIRFNVEHNLNIGIQQQMAYRKGSSSSSYGYSIFRGGEASTWLTGFVNKITSQFPKEIYLPCTTAINADRNHLIYKIRTIYRSYTATVSRQGWAPSQYIYHPDKDMNWNSYYLIAMLEGEKVNRCGKHFSDSSYNTQRIMKVCNATIDLFTATKNKDCCYNHMVRYALNLCNQLDEGFLFRNASQNDIRGEKCLATSRQYKHATCGDYENINPNLNAGSRVVEATGYAALFYMARDDMKNALPLIMWLVNQRNENGGFRSSQDTVIGLQALATFARITGSDVAKKTDLLITVGKGKSLTDKFTINEKNKLSTQEVILEPSTGTFKIKWSGKGVAFVQLISTYHVSELNYKSIYGLTATTTVNEYDNMSYLKIAFTLPSNTSTMFLLDISAVTGTVFRKALIEGQYQLTDTTFDIITRYDVKEGGQRLLLYIDPSARLDVEIRVPFEEKFDVEDKADAQVTLVDYYNPSKRETVFYSVDEMST